MKIDRRGVVDDGSMNLEVAGWVYAGAGVIAGHEEMIPAVLQGSCSAGLTSIPMATPGFYTFPADGASTAKGYFTGSVPSALNYPGSTLVCRDTGGAVVGGSEWCLTGSAWLAGAPVAVFSMQPGVSSSNSRNHGTHLKVNASGSVVMTSDGYNWCITAGSGSLRLFGPPTIGDPPA